MAPKGWAGKSMIWFIMCNSDELKNLSVVFIQMNFV